MYKLKYLWLILAIVSPLVSGCDSDSVSEPDQPETPMFPKDPLDYPADGKASYLYSLSNGIIINGEFHDINENPHLLEQLRAQSELQPTNVFEVSMTAPGKLEKLTGEHARVMDKLIVSGPINLKDLYFIRDCAAFLNLRSVDLSKATMEKNTIPPMAFTKSMYHNDKITLVMLPLFNIDLPENIEHIGIYAFRDVLLTGIKFPPSLKSLDLGSFTHTILLCGDIIFPDGLEIIPERCFEYSSDRIGHVFIPYSVKEIHPFVFKGAKVTSFTLSEGLEYIYEGALPTDLDKVILPSTLKNFSALPDRHNPELKELYCLAENPPYAPSFYTQIYDFILYVPKGSLQKYRSNSYWKRFNNIIELDDMPAL